MEAHTHFGKLGVKHRAPHIKARRSSLLVALISAALAAVLIYAFVSRYHRTTVAPAPSATVFVATRYIPAGTPQATVAADGLLRPKAVPLGQAIVGAISDPSQVAGQVVAQPIAAGQQASTTDFTHANLTIGSYLSGPERAVAIAIDPAHGLTSYLSLGDTVDVMAQGMKNHRAYEFVLFEHATVLGNQGGDVVLELTDKQSLALQSTLTHGYTLWLALRPVTGATNPVHAGYGEGS